MAVSVRMSHHVLRNSSPAAASSAVRELREQNLFSDVTLVCEDGAALAGHRLILAAHSSRLQRVLAQMAAAAPSPAVAQCVYLAGVRGAELADILEFIYAGEVRVGQKQLSRFLDVAQKLHVNGLMDDSVQSQQNSDDGDNSSMLMSTNSLLKRKKKTPDPEIEVKSEFHSSVDANEEYVGNNDGEQSEQPESDDVNNLDNSEQPVDFYEGENFEFDDDDVSDDDQDEENETENPVTINISKSPEKQKSPRKRKIVRDNLETPTEEEKSTVLLENLRLLDKRLCKEVMKDTKSRKIFKKVMSKPMAKLPCPVQYMNVNQLSAWLTREIPKDVIEQGKRPRTLIKWGDAECRPRCWPEELWPWHLVTNPVHGQKRKPAHVDGTEAWRVAVRNRLRDKNVDPDTFVSEDFTERDLIMKKRIRGIPTKL